MSTWVEWGWVERHHGWGGTGGGLDINMGGWGGVQLDIKMGGWGGSRRQHEWVEVGCLWSKE